MKKIIIKHIKGSKANQTEAFDLPITELALGRDITADIRFDPERDDIVGRAHAKLHPVAGSADSFTLTDLNSRNGSFINGMRIVGSAVLNPGDTIKLGEGGPEFVFDLDPRPQIEVKPTRLFEDPTPPTRESVAPSNSSFQSEIAPRGVGRNTVEKLIHDSHAGTQKKLVNFGSVVVVLVLLAGGALFYLGKQDRNELISAINNTEQLAAQKLQTLDTKIEEAIPKTLSSSQIAEMYSQSTVYIESSWKLIDVATQNPLFQKKECSSRDLKGKCQDQVLPWYISIGDTVEPYLVTKAEGPDGPNELIGGKTLSGSGFVVKEDGYILTNRHVAANWETAYSGLNYDGYLKKCISTDCSTNIVLPIKEISEFPKIIDKLVKWVPAQTKIKEERIANDKFVEGRNIYLDVTFPDNRNKIPATIAQISNIADVTLLQISLPDKLSFVALAEKESVQPGNQITVIGYPSVSPDVYVKTNSQDPFNREEQIRKIPRPTVSSSTIAKVINGQAKIIGNTTTEYFSEFGDVYQLNLNTTGAGNSGGPVFNDQGEVIGVFSYGLTDSQGTQITFAIPIKYGQELMGMNPIIKRDYGNDLHN